MRWLLRLTPEGRLTLQGLRSRKTTSLAQASELLERLLEDGGE
jgi:hypothetical protein